MIEPSDKEKNVLAKLFATSSTAPRKRPMAFDPTAESSNVAQQKKKKCVVRPVNRDVIFLPEPCSTEGYQSELEQTGSGQVFDF